MDALALGGDIIPFYRYGNNIQDHIEVTVGERIPEQLSLTPQPRVYQVLPFPGLERLWLVEETDRNTLPG